MEALLAKATRSEKDRRVVYKWRSAMTMDLDNDGRPWGDQITLSFSHDSLRKEYYAVVSYCQYQVRDGFACERFGLLDQENYPRIQLAKKSVARYGAKSFGEFETLVVNGLDKFAECHDTVGMLLTRASGYCDSMVSQ